MQCLKYKAAWAALGILLMLLMLSCPVLCDTTNPDTANTLPSLEEIRKAYRSAHLPWAVVDAPEMVAELIKNGEDVNATDENGVTALHWAVLYDRYGTAKLLLENGANVNVKEHSKAGGFCGWGWYPLHLALRNENREIIRLLIDHGADVNAPRTDGWTPLNTAAHHGQSDVIELLISKGADVKVYDSEPLRTAITQGRYDAARIMIKHGANVSGKNPYDESPVLIASQCNNIPMAKLLIDNKANVDIPNIDGKTPLFYAAYNGHLEMVKLLVSKGADVNTHAKDNMSILQAVTAGKKAFLASKYKRDDLAKRDWYGVKRVLLRHGVKE